MDRRHYARLPSFVDCTLLESATGREFLGKLYDISEGGVCVFLKGNEFPSINSTCIIQFADKFRDMNFIVMEPIRIINLNSIEDGARLGGVFLRELSPQCVNYIRILSAKSYFPDNVPGELF